MFEKSGSNITYLSLSRTYWEDEYSLQIISAIKLLPNLEYLDLSSCPVGSKNCNLIIEALENTSNLISLNLSSSGINYRVDTSRWRMTMMDSCTSKPPPQTVLVNEALCHLISTKKSLRILDLSSNGSIIEGDRKAIAEALKNNSTSITDLNLSQTQVQMTCPLHFQPSVG